LEKRKKITLRFTEEQYQKLKNFSDEQGMTFQKIFEKLFEKKKIIPKTELQELLVEMKHQGNNLNQLLKLLNSKSFLKAGVATADDELKTVLAELGKILKSGDEAWQLLKQYLQQPR